MGRRTNVIDEAHAERLAKTYYVMADAMLKEREK